MVSLELKAGGADKLDRKVAYYLLSVFDEGQISTKLFSTTPEDFGEMAQILRDGLARKLPMTLVTPTVYQSIKGWYFLDPEEALEAVVRRLDHWASR